MRVRRFNTGHGIPGVSSGWESVTFSARCSYDNNEGLVDTYGYLYNWFAAGDGRLCPTGWHVPNDAEWTALVDYLGGSGIAGAKMKESGLTHWNSPNIGATNESGFSGLPGGRRNHIGSFSNIGDLGFWWSSTELNSATALRRNLDYNDDNVKRSENISESGFSIRCLRD